MLHKTITLTLLIAPLITQATIETAEYYNILSVDGGGIRGIIPGVCLEKMEEYAWEYAQTRPYKDNIPTYDGKSKRVALKDFFHMFAGTSTGSILAAGLAYPSHDNIDVPKYFSSDILDIYRKDGELIFKPNNVRSDLLAFWIIISMIVFFSIGYCIGVYIYDNPETKKALKEMKKTQMLLKKESLNKFIKDTF